MKRLIRDCGRTLLITLLIACAAAIAGLGATVHVFTLQQTKAVDESTITMAVRKWDISRDENGQYIYTRDENGNFVWKTHSTLMETVNSFPGVRVPALLKSYAALAKDIIPVPSSYPEDQYNYSRDNEHRYMVLQVTCLEELSPNGANDWISLVQVDEVLAAPAFYDVPDIVRVEGNAEERYNTPPLVPGESYILSGKYLDYPLILDSAASFIKGYYNPVYVRDRSEPPCLVLRNWWDVFEWQSSNAPGTIYSADADYSSEYDWMKYIASPDDQAWIDTAVKLANDNNTCIQLFCLNDLERVLWFQNGTAMLTAGRSFTQKELDTGARVCIIHQELAAYNGLSVGDHITVTAYDKAVEGFEQAGYSHYYSFRFVNTLEEQGEELTYEIIGLYSSPLWHNAPKANTQHFLPNAVFAPYDSATLEQSWHYKRPLFLQNVIIENGTGDAFLQYMKDSGYADGVYTIEETNCDAVREVLALMSADSLTLLAISSSVGVLMLIVVLALYVRGWRKENAILAMLGTTKVRIGWRMCGSLTVLTLLGCAIAFGGMCAAKSYIETALNSVYIGQSADFSAIRVGAFSEDGMTIGVEIIAVALGLTAVVFLLIAAIQSIVSARKKVRECLFD